MANNGTKRNNYLAVDSTHRTNPDLHQQPVFQSLTAEINRGAATFLISLGCNNDYIQKLGITNMWANISYPGDFVGPHIHSNSVLSGVYYVKKFPGSKIRFYKNIYSMIHIEAVRNDLSYATCDYDCDPGRLLLWQSDVLHGTDQQTGDEKIAVSFNIGFT